VSDDGVGMLPAAEKHEPLTGLTSTQSSYQEQTSGYHQGLVVLRERAALLGGKLSFANGAIAGKGTRLEVEIPLPLKGSTDTYSHD
jgi:signal transduction histidine kinase